MRKLRITLLNHEGETPDVPFLQTFTQAPASAGWLGRKHNPSGGAQWFCNGVPGCLKSAVLLLAGIGTRTTSSRGGSTSRSRAC